MWLLHLVNILITLTTVTKCQTVNPLRSVSEIGNPMVDVDKCGRRGMSSHVCDPDGLLTVEQAYQLDDQIRSIYNDTNCPCSSAVCKKKHISKGEGYMVGIAIVRGMMLDPKVEMLSIYKDLDDRYIDGLMSEARLFAYSLLDAWGMGRCQEDLLIFYSMNDNVLYTVTNAKARSLLQDDLVTDIAVSTRINFIQGGESIADGFKEILGLYKAILLGIYQRTTPFLTDDQDDSEDLERLLAMRYRSFATKFSPKVFVTLLSSVLFVLFL